MPSVLAIVSKAIFEKNAPRGAAMGALFATDRYTSKNKLFESVGPDDAIFLVTVRPPDERLWLVGILESPTFDDGSWVSAANATPIADVTALVSRLRFQSGLGLSAKPGTLGMSLQTPRLLSEEDVVLLGAAVNRTSPKKPSKDEAASSATLEEGPGDGKKAALPKAKPAAVAKAPKARAGTGTSSKHWDAAAVLASLGFEFSAAESEGEVAAVVHTASGVELLAVPGGQMMMGFTVDDIFSVFRVVNGNDSLAELLVTDGFGHSRPPRVVEVRPFLFARNALTDAQHQGTPDTLAAIRELGFRLPSDAEWEWVARELGRRRFVSTRADAPTSLKKLDIVFEKNGVGASGFLDEGERVADGWHDSYDGAPSTSAAWDPDRPPWGVRMGHTAIQGDEEVIALHAAFREKNHASSEKGGKRRARAALDWKKVC